MTSWWQKVSLSTFVRNAPQRLRRFGESKAHEKAKDKIADVLRDRGFTCFVDSYPFECQTDKGERTYWPDVYAQNFCTLYYTSEKSASISQGVPRGLVQSNRRNAEIQRCGRRIIVEIQGFKGHKSKAAFHGDRLRIQDIRDSHGSDIECFQVHLNSRIGPLDIRSWTRLDIEEFLNIADS
jgi:hypothetical protein